MLNWKQWVGFNDVMKVLNIRNYVMNLALLLLF